MNIMNHFMEKNGIDWEKLGSLCTDGGGSDGKAIRIRCANEKKVSRRHCDTLCAPSPCPCDQDAPQGAR